MKKIWVSEMQSKLLFKRIDNNLVFTKIGSQDNMINIIIFLIVLKISINRIIINQVYDLMIKKKSIFILI